MISGRHKPHGFYFPTKDGRHVTASCVTDSEWGDLQVLDRPDWIEDERFNNAFNRTVNGEERKKLMAEEIARFNSKISWIALSNTRRRQRSIVNRMELMKNAQVQARQKPLRRITTKVSAMCRQPPVLRRNSA